MHAVACRMRIMTAMLARYVWMHAHACTGKERGVTRGAVYRAHRGPPDYASWTPSPALCAETLRVISTAADMPCTHMLLTVGPMLNLRHSCTVCACMWVCLFMHICIACLTHSALQLVRACVAWRCHLPPACTLQHSGAVNSCTALFPSFDVCAVCACLQESGVSATSVFRVLHVLRVFRVFKLGARLARAGKRGKGNVVYCTVL